MEMESFGFLGRPDSPTQSAGGQVERQSQPAVHRTTIEKLRANNAHLMEELRAEQRKQRLIEARAAQSEISRLHDLCDTYTRSTLAEKRRMQELDKQITILHQNIEDRRRKMGGINASKADNQALARQIDLLETRLQQSQKRLSSKMVKNKELRAMITQLRRERIEKDQLYAETEARLKERKEELARITQRSMDAYEKRDAAHAELRALRAQMQKEQTDFDVEWQELGQMVERDKLMKDFMHKERARLGIRDRIESPESMRRKKSGSSSVKDSVSKAPVGSYEDAFNEIIDATGITELTELVSGFIDLEDTNFDIFNNVNALSAECDRMEKHVVEIKGEVEKLKGNGMNADNQRKKMLKELEDRLRAVETEVELYERKCEAATKTVNALKAGIMLIFTRIGCATPSNLELLGTDGVTESNMSQYLGIIEQRTNEMLQLYASAHATARESGGVDANGNPLPSVTSIFGQGPQEKMSGQRFMIQPPSVASGIAESEEDDDDAEVKPFNREELLARAMRGVAKRVGGKDAKKYRAKINS